VVNAGRFETAALRIVCPITRTRRDYPYRIEIEPSRENGLSVTSYVQVEHIRTVSVWRVVRTMGTLDAITLMNVQRVLRLLLDL
jgi:mRNA-degrading endonuclease toxin of MazEF toxin-antitoxin module